MIQEVIVLKVKKVRISDFRKHSRESKRSHGFYQIAFRKKVYQTVEEIQADADEWLMSYNQDRPHSGKYCYGKTPMETFEKSVLLVRDKMIHEQSDNRIAA